MIIFVIVAVVVAIATRATFAIRSTTVPAVHVNVIFAKAAVVATKTAKTAVINQFYTTLVHSLTFFGKGVVFLTKVIDFCQIMLYTEYIAL